MTHQENVSTFIEAWTSMVHLYPLGQRIQENGVASMFAHVPLSFMNMSILDRPAADEADFRSLLTIARERAQLCTHPSVAGLCDAWAPKGWEAIASEEGFQVGLNITGMKADVLKPPRRPAPEVTWRRVDDVQTARAIGEINAPAYGMPLEWFECTAEPQYWSGHMHAYVGYQGGRAVTCAAAFPVPGSMYVAYVATLPEAQGRGLAEAAMRKAISEAEKVNGTMPLILHASDAGAPLYRSMGFVDAARVPILTLADGSNGH